MTSDLLSRGLDTGSPLNGAGLQRNSIFAYMPSLTIDPSSGGHMTVLAKSEPTKAFGVGIVSSRSLGEIRCFGLSADQHGLWLQRSGQIAATTRLDGRRFDYRAGPGSINIRPVGMETVTDNRGLLEGILVRVSAECLALAKEQLGAPTGTLVERLDARDGRLLGIGRALEAEAAAGHPNGQLYWSEGADALIQHLATCHLSKPAVTPRGTLTVSELSRLDAYVRANLAGPLDVPGMAAIVGYDCFRFNSCFRRTVGVSPHRYVVRRRLEQARSLIRSGRDPLSQIALATGFSDQSHLCRWMRQVYNLSPRELRPDR